MIKERYALFVLAISCYASVFGMEEENPEQLVCSTAEYNYLVELYKSHGVDVEYAKPMVPTDSKEVNTITKLRLLIGRDLGYEALKIPQAATGRYSNHGKMYYCNDCNFSMESSYKLTIKAHERWHAALPGYACEKCLLTYDSQAGIKWHNSRYHKASTED